MRQTANRKGGLDARYLISHIKDKPYSIKSLASIATPHRGSSFMDFCRDNLGLGKIETDEILELDKQFQSLKPPVEAEKEWLKMKDAGKRAWLEKIFRQIDAPAYEYMAAFNRVTLDDPSVYYTSYAASTSLKIYAPLGILSRIVTEKEGENDGVVSVDSAIWGDFQGVVDCDHWDLVPSSSRTLTDNFKKQPFRHIDFYRSVVTQLANQGC